jgi:threonine dehydrogenase-like Zn-dependent dehydrogenase
MRALTVLPGRTGSARLDEVQDPAPEDGAILVQTLAVGVCGTDRHIVEGHYGWSPPGRDRLILGHEVLGRVVQAPEGSGWSAGDLLVDIVRRPDPVPCPSCAVGEWDMCRNSRYTERGIKSRDGYCAEWFRTEPAYAVRLPAWLEAGGVLLEPASVVAKAWEHIERIGQRALWQPARVLVTGAGPIGLLAAMMGMQRGLQVHVLDRVAEGPKPRLVQDLGATYHTGRLAHACPGADVVIECTGAPELVLEAVAATGPGGIVCLAGLSSGRREMRIDAAALNRVMVLENDVVFGVVNANRRHYKAAVEALARAHIGWLARLITRRVPLARWADALDQEPHDVKTVIEVTR